MPAPEPTLARKIAAALATALIVAAVWWIIHWRSAPPVLGASSAMEATEKILHPAGKNVRAVIPPPREDMNAEGALASIREHGPGGRIFHFYSRRHSRDA